MYKEGEILYTKEGKEVVVIAYREDMGYYPLFVRDDKTVIALTKEGKHFHLDKEPYVFKSKPEVVKPGIGELCEVPKIADYVRHLEKKISILEGQIEVYKKDYVPLRLIETTLRRKVMSKC